MITADLNRDGQLEILVGYVKAPGVIYFNDGSGTKYQRMPFGDDKGATYGMAAADLDGDGWPDSIEAAKFLAFKIGITHSNRFMD